MRPSTCFTAFLRSRLEAAAPRLERLGGLARVDAAALDELLDALLDVRLGGAERRLGVLPRLLEAGSWPCGPAPRRRRAAFFFAGIVFLLTSSSCACAGGVSGPALARGRAAAAGFSMYASKAASPPRSASRERPATPSPRSRSARSRDSTPGLGLADQAVDQLAEVLAQGHGLVEAQPAPAEEPGRRSSRPPGGRAPPRPGARATRPRPRRGRRRGG